MKLRIRAGLIAGMAVVSAVRFASDPRAAETEFTYGASAGEVYSQDVERQGDNADDDYIATLRLHADLLVETPRSQTSLRYAPDYLSYAHHDTLGHLDHRQMADWRLRTGPTSVFELRQGYSKTTWQTGFQDLAGVGGNPSEPVIARTNRVAWDLEPSLSLSPTHGTTFTTEAIYREEHYEEPDLIDSWQAGVAGGWEGRVGRSQSVGGRLRADVFRFSTDSGPIADAFDQFLNAQVSWSSEIGERRSLTAAAGAYRGSGQRVGSVTGPTADLAGRWKWRKVDLLAAYGLGYSSGGGVSTVDRSQQGQIALHGRWGRGFEAGADLAYIHRESLGDQSTTQNPLDGRSIGLNLTKNWQPGIGMTLWFSHVRQEQLGMPDLDSGQAAMGVVYAPPRRERGAEPSP